MPILVDSAFSVGGPLKTFHYSSRPVIRGGDFFSDITGSIGSILEKVGPILMKVLPEVLPMIAGLGIDPGASVAKAVGAKRARALKQVENTIEQAVRAGAKKKVPQIQPEIVNQIQNKLIRGIIANAAQKK